MKLGEKGFTLIELLVVTAIVVLIANAAALTTFQVLTNTASNRNEMTAVSQVRNAGYWVSLDAQRAQSVQAQGLGGGAGSITIFWKQSESGDLESDDALYFAFSGDGGNSWSSNIEAFHNDSPPGSFSYPVPDEYITDDFRVRYFLQSFSGSDYWGTEYAYLDDIAVCEAVFSDDCSSFADWSNDNDWTISSGHFTGHHLSGGTNDRYLNMTTTQDLSSYQGSTVKVSWAQSEDGALESDDALYFAFSSDNGTNWGNNIEAFHDDITPSYFSYPIPSQYLTNGFRMRFYLGSFSNSDDGYAYIDDILISVPIWSDGCSSFANWANGGDWGVSSGQFRGHHSGADDNRYLTMNTSLDLLTEVYGAGFPLTFTWITWSESGGTEHQVTYSIVDGWLIRSYSVAGGTPTETKVAEYVDPYNTSCQFANGKLTLSITTAVGGATAEANETRQFQVVTRPD